VKQEASRLSSIYFGSAGGWANGAGGMRRGRLVGAGRIERRRSTTQVCMHALY